MGRPVVRRDGERSRKLIMLQYLNGADMEPRIKLAPEARRGKIDWKLWTNEIEREVSGDWALKKEEEKVVGFREERRI